MIFLGILLLAVSAYAQPTVYIARSSLSEPIYRVYLDEPIPEVAIVKETEAKDEKEAEVIPEAPVLNPLTIEKSDELEAEEPKEELEEKKEEEEELDHKGEEERKEEVLKEEAPKKEESEEDKKIVVELDVPKPPKFITSIISALPIKLPSFEWPFDLSSLWKPKQKQIRLVPAYGMREWVSLAAEK